jgi:tRNA pseudouridine55 synthase
MGAPPLDGIINIDKPYGMTSMEVVRRLKRASGQKHVGHGGTLDPVATGVVPVCFGQATRMMEYLIDGTKEYRAVIELGAATDTYDALGEVTSRADPSRVRREDVTAALESFIGVIEQVPPMYSALKRQGRPLYELARAGIEVEREPRKVEVLRAELQEWSPPLATIEVSCGRGFYMRSLAHDLGQALGCGAHLKALTRLRSGPFKLSDAVPLEDAERSFADSTWQEFLHAPDVALYNLRAAIVSKRLEDMIRQGRPLPPALRVPFSRPNEQCRAYSLDGRFLAVLTFDAAAGQWRADKVFSLSYPDL